MKEGYVDHTQFDRKDPHYDPSSSKDNPKWFMVDVKYVRKLKRFISLKELKTIHLEHKTSGGALQKLSLFTRARLSVQPLTEGKIQPRDMLLMKPVLFLVFKMEYVITVGKCTC